MAISPPATESNGNVLEGNSESEELKKFRQEWLQEVGKRNTLDEGTGGTLAIPPNQVEDSSVAKRFVTNAKEPRDMSDHPLISDGEISVQDDMPPSLERALDIYRRAVSLEQTGKLDEALVLYRQAFRLDDKVAYQRILKLESIAKQQEDIKSHVEDHSALFQGTAIVKPSVLKENLVKIIRAYPTDVTFEPENEDEPVLLNILPEEVLVLIISNLEPTSIERFAMVSRRASLVCLDVRIWRVLVFSTYRSPQIPDHEMLLTALESYHFDYRRVFIELPRVRLDGVYIAICQYVRHGLGANHWINISHLITYHRYLRFFADGEVLSLLANEEKDPQEIISLLKPNLRMKGLFLGQWKLVGTTVHISHLVDASPRFAFIEAAQPDINHVSSDSNGRSQSPNTNPTFISRRQGEGSIPTAQADAARYTFDMTLNLRSKPLGRWNRMDIQTYDTLNLENGDVCPVALQHERPFWFSKVRSYT